MNTALLGTILRDFGSQLVPAGGRVGHDWDASVGSE